MQSHRDTKKTERKKGNEEEERHKEQSAERLNVAVTPRNYRVSNID
jgi:hypothetical protein